MKKLLMASAATLALTGAASAEDVKLGVLIGFTGPIESLTGHMAAAADLAMKEASESGKFMNGSTVVGVRADSTCTASAAATSAAERLVTAEGIKGMVGCNPPGQYLQGGLLFSIFVSRLYSSSP